MIAIEFLLTPLVACLILVLINVYFGIHVIKREIIFIDIAMAQIAAMGSAVAMILFQSAHPGHMEGHREHNAFAYLFSLLFVTLASLVFSILRNKKIPVPIEAIIGIAYAAATTGTVIILDKGAGGDVHVHDMLIGAILWVSWHQVTRLFVIALLVGIFHIIFRKKFTGISDIQQKQEQNIPYKAWWDFLFYFSLGIVIIEAVNIAGILTVFAMLIIPASIGFIFTGNWRGRLCIGWISGAFASLAGLCLSFLMDVPCSPVIIILLGIILLMGSALKSVRGQHT